MASRVKEPSYDPRDAGNAPGNGPLRVGGAVPKSRVAGSDADLPSTLSPSAKKQAPAVSIVRDLWGGTETVRDKATEYLPRAPGEKNPNYQARLKRSVFFNAFRKTVEGLTGFVFAKDPELGDDVPVQIAGTEEEGGHWENIDNSGTHGDVFIRDLLQDAMAAGHAAILVDFPNTGGGQSAADEMEIRPYWVPIRKENILSWRTTTENGRLVLTQLVLRECTYVPDGQFGEKERTQYRVFYRNEGIVGFHLLEIAEDKKTVFVVDEGLYPTQDEIPVAEVGTSGKRSLFDSDPPLIDLAYLNISHYQQLSDYATAIHMTSVPLLVTIGLDSILGEDGKPQQDVVVGPNSHLPLPVGGDAKYIAHDGAALASSKAALDDLKADMGTLGIAMLAPQKRAAETAEAKRIDKSTTDSALGVTARALQDGVERALGFHAKYLRLDSGGSIEINRDFDSNTMDPAVMTAYVQAAAQAGLPIRILLKMWQMGGRIADDEDLEELEAEMMAEQAAIQERKAAEAAASFGGEKKDPAADGSPTPPKEQDK